MLCYIQVKEKGREAQRLQSFPSHRGQVQRVCRIGHQTDKKVKDISGHNSWDHVVFVKRPSLSWSPSKTFVSNPLWTAHKPWKKTIGVSPDIMFTLSPDFFMIFFILAKGNKWGPVLPPENIPEIFQLASSSFCAFDL